MKRNLNGLCKFIKIVIAGGSLTSDASVSACGNNINAIKAGTSRSYLYYDKKNVTSHREEISYSSLILSDYKYNYSKVL